MIHILKKKKGGARRLQDLVGRSSNESAFDFNYHCISAYYFSLDKIIVEMESLIVSTKTYAADSNLSYRVDVNTLSNV